MFLFKRHPRRIVPPPLTGRHAANVPYALLLNTDEASRLDFQHFMLRYALRGNYLAPVRRPVNILDVGTGTGRWAIEMAQKFSEAHVASIDSTSMANLALIRALTLMNQRPPDNFVFLEGNVLAGLDFANNTFDFTHMRLLTAAIPAVSWRTVVADLVRVTTHGGYVELVEVGGSENGGPAMDQLVQWGATACLYRGIDVSLSARIGTFLRDAGLRGVYFSKLDIPIGKWAGRMGEMMEKDYFGALTAMRPAIVPQLADGSIFDEVLDHARAEAQTYRATCPFYIAYGQKS